MAHPAHAISFSAPGGGVEVSAGATSRSASAAKSSARPVDLVHLARQSLGDRELEIEILGMFLSQSALYLDRLSHAKSAEDRKLAAHTILGSARGIGAWKVADEAQKIELSKKKATDLGPLRRELDATNEFITSILGES